MNGLYYPVRRDHDLWRNANDQTGPSILAFFLQQLIVTGCAAATLWQQFVGQSVNEIRRKGNPLEA